MHISDFKPKLEEALKERDLQIFWFREANDFVSFAAIQAAGSTEPKLIAGLGWASGNSPRELLKKYNQRFMEAVVLAGIPKDAIYENLIDAVYKKACPPVFVVRVKKEMFQDLA